MPRFGGRVTRGMLAVGLIAAGCAVQGQSRDARVARGAQLFTDHGCYGCHTVGKTGTPIATDLTRVGTRHTEPALLQWLRDPASQKPTAHMPRIAMRDADARDLAAYLASLR
jgi:mono/diheme cytochrome c family protein